jgi:hypothetical protein
MQVFCDGVVKRVTDGIQTGLNYWGGWSGARESIFDDDGKDGYILNAKGNVLANLYAAYPVVKYPPVFTAKGQAQVVSDGKGGMTITLTGMQS